MGKIIGIDPAFRKNGMAVAVIDKDSKTVYSEILNGVIDFYKFINSFNSDEIDLIIIENAHLQNVTFEKKDNSKILARISRNVGMVQAVSAQMVQIAKDLVGDKRVISVSPKEKGVKIYDKKIFEAYLRSLGLKYVGERNTQDIRDAVKIATIGLTLHFY